MLRERLVRDLNHREYTYDEFVEIIKAFDKMGAEFYIGTDSQVVKRKISIVTSVCVCAGSGNNRAFYVKDKISKKDLRSLSLPDYIIEKTRDKSALRMRMLLEAYRSIEAAMELEPLISGTVNVHLDIGSTDKSKSSLVHKELEYLVQSQGYECSIKPEAWAASSVADRVAKS